MEVAMTTVSKLTLVASACAGIVCVGFSQTVSAKDRRDTSQTPAAQRQLAPGLIVPTMDLEHGKHLFASKGCVVCHSINGVGGTDAPKLDASTMAPVMNPFEFFAKMWRGATPMIAMQQHEIGHQIQFTGQELADIVAYVHNRQVQKTFSKVDIPPAIKKHMQGD
jgi:mono/diheme cytochrome c family protein